MDLITVIIPFLNEEDNMPRCCEFIDSFCADKDFSLEVIFVDDGSVDQSVEIIETYNFKYCNSVKTLRLTKNYGSHAAVRAGIQHAKGKYCVPISADLQEPSDMIDLMYLEIKRGYHVIYIEKRHVQVSLFNRIASVMYVSLMRRFAINNYGKGAINNFMFDRKVIDYLNTNIEPNSALNLQIINSGFKCKTLQMDYNRRNIGKSKWTFSKKLKLFIDSFVSFSYMPLHLVTALGTIMALFGGVWGLYIIVRYFQIATPIPGYASLMAMLLFGFGTTNISLGILAAYLWRTFDAARKRPVFLINEIIKHK